MATSQREIAQLQMQLEQAASELAEKARVVGQHKQVLSQLQMERDDAVRLLASERRQHQAPSAEVK